MTKTIEHYKEHTPYDYIDSGCEIDLLDSVKSLGHGDEPIEFIAFEHLDSGTAELGAPNLMIQEFVEELMDRRTPCRAREDQQPHRDSAFKKIVHHAQWLYKEYPDNGEEVLRRVGVWHSALEPDIDLDVVLGFFTGTN